MKQHWSFINKTLFGLLMLVLSSCTDFEELNSDPTKSGEMDPNMQMSYVQLSTFGMVEPSNTIQSYASAFVQHFQGEYGKTYHGGKYRVVDQLIATLWTDFYNKPVKNLVDIIAKTSEKPDKIHLNAIARIYKVYLFSLITDFYGDIPYFDAGKGYLNQNFTPKYDTQEKIYEDFFNELKLAVEQLSSSSAGEVISGDLIYQGDVVKWKKLANSLNLRLGLRLVKVNPELAKMQVSASLDPARGGVFTSTQDQAFIPYLVDIFDWDINEIRRNAHAQLYIGREPAPLAFLCTTYWKYLKDSKDPRLFKIGRTYWGEGANFNGLEAFKRKDITEEVLAKGGIDKFQPVDPGYFWYERWPSGYWSPTLNIWVDKWTRPQLNMAFLKSNIPGIIMSYAETELLLADAKTRWPEIASSLSNDAHYQKGVEAAMDLLAQTYKIDEISTAEKTTYWDSNEFPTSENQQLKVINEQLWVLHLTNPAEAYSNWRRSGYPELKSAKTYGAITIDAQEIPRRLPYPLFEKSYNPTHYQEAIQRIGGVDDWNIPVWWDKKL